MTPTPITLTDQELDAVLDRLAPSGREFRSACLARKLAFQHSIEAPQINATCRIGNISDVVAKSVNPRIRDLGLFVACAKSPGGATLSWSFYRGQAPQDALRGDLSALQADHPQDYPSGAAKGREDAQGLDAANDPAYQADALQDALRRDLSALQTQHPQDYQPSLNESADAWEDVLSLAEINDQRDAANDPQNSQPASGRGRK